MEPYVARAFLNRLLNEEEKKDLRKMDLSLQVDQPGRYLQGFEICRRYNLSPKPLPEDDTEKMDLLLWKWKKKLETTFDEMREKHGDESFNINGDSLLGDLWDWEEFADKNYQETLHTLLSEKV